MISEEEKTGAKKSRATVPLKTEIWRYYSIKFKTKWNTIGKWKKEYKFLYNICFYPTYPGSSWGVLEHFQLFEFSVF